MKVIRVGSRGTKAYVKDDEPQNWAGDVYRKVELEKLEKVPTGQTLHLGRGVRTTTVGEIPEPQPRPSTEGMARVTNRGTSSRTSKNKGTTN